jgi:bacterioferritin (cytochrome b1)
MERCSNETLKAQREQQIFKEDMQAEQERHRETKDLMRKCEEKCTSLYQDLISTNKEGVERWSDI